MTWRTYVLDEEYGSMAEFIELHLSHGGRGFYLLDAYRLYREWCQHTGTIPKGKMFFSAELEGKGYARTDRRDKVRHHGRIKVSQTMYPPLRASTRHEVKEDIARRRELKRLERIEVKQRNDALRTKREKEKEEREKKESRRLTYVEKLILEGKRLV